MPTNAHKRKSKTPIVTANGYIYPSHAAIVQMTTTKGVKLKLPCSVCKEVQDNLVSVLDIASRYNGVPFDGSETYIVTKRHMNRIKKR